MATRAPVAVASFSNTEDPTSCVFGLSISRIFEQEVKAKNINYNSLILFIQERF